MKLYSVNQNVLNNALNINNKVKEKRNNGLAKIEINQLQKAYPSSYYINFQARKTVNEMYEAFGRNSKNNQMPTTIQECYEKFQQIASDIDYSQEDQQLALEALKSDDFVFFQKMRIMIY